jgi:hypothetical protein
LRCLCVLCSYHLEKKESRLPSMSPFVFILYTIWSISSSPGEQNTKNNLHLISNSCSYTGLFPSSYSLCVIVGWKIFNAKTWKEEKKSKCIFGVLKK